jgi:hypothetical protein
MEQLSNFKILNITSPKANEYLLDCEVNGQKHGILAQVTMQEPIFGVNLPDEVILILRNHPVESRLLVEVIKKFHQGAKSKLPIMIVSKSSNSNLKAA